MIEWIRDKEAMKIANKTLEQLHVLAIKHKTHEAKIIGDGHTWFGRDFINQIKEGKVK